MAVSPASVKGDAISLGITPLRGAFDETLRLVMKLVMKPVRTDVPTRRPCAMAVAPKTDTRRPAQVPVRINT